MSGEEIIYMDQPCPKCGARADIYPVDIEGKQWQISCESFWKICDFEISCTDRSMLTKLWEHACKEIKRENI